MGTRWKRSEDQKTRRQAPDEMPRGSKGGMRRGYLSAWNPLMSGYRASRSRCEISGNSEICVGSVELWPRRRQTSDARSSMKWCIIQYIATNNHSYNRTHPFDQHNQDVSMTSHPQRIEMRKSNSMSILASQAKQYTNRPCRLSHGTKT